MRKVPTQRERTLDVLHYGITQYYCIIGTMAALLQEIVAIYPAINPPTLTVRYNLVCVLVA